MQHSDIRGRLGRWAPFISDSAAPEPQLSDDRSERLADDLVDPADRVQAGRPERPDIVGPPRLGQIALVLRRNNRDPSAARGQDKGIADNGPIT